MQSNKADLAVNTLLYALSSRLPCRIIAEGQRRYLERYYLCTLFGVRFYLHRFVDSDPGRGLHDHPWPWAFSIILSGWYLEQTRRGEHKVRWLNFLVGDNFHRVVLPGAYVNEPQPCWTLFAHRAAYVKPWGFWSEQDGGVWEFPGGRRVVAAPKAQWVQHLSRSGDAWWKRVPKGRDEPRRAPR